MSDTPREVAQVLTERYRERTPAERVRMAASMFKVATSLARAGLRSRYPEASEAEIRLMLLRRLYDGDLTPLQFTEIGVAIKVLKPELAAVAARRASPSASTGSRFES